MGVKRRAGWAARGRDNRGYVIGKLSDVTVISEDMTKMTSRF